ncbi:MAG: hypothetical protein HWQ38_08080 [Nostoc sp. NMS7]|uniref:hypothetical protein n=1 Tax=Nostoc sp. NMS7 TaxID=2815391 RepID=UPI0025DDDA15|nr:hypothetical protein [Nostoc sp. NMS7]MBN3946440.1 hypothetical protein [Nostoc sp. NMS7]
MNYKLRGVEYAIANSSDTILTKIAVSMKNGMADWEDDARVAYAVSVACPSIPSDIASYKPPNEFTMSLDSMEIAVFMLSLNIAILQKSKVQSDADKAAVRKKIQELNKSLLSIDKGLTSEQVKLLVGQVTVTEQNTDAESILVESQVVDEPLSDEEEAIARRYLKQQESK